MQPRVSVIIPAYNAESFLRRTLISALNQTYKNIEVLVIDDCSTDGTRRLVEQVAASDSRVRYVRLEKNSNLPAVPRNVGARLSRGAYLAWLDHDDVWFRRKLERQVLLLDSLPEAALVHGSLLPYPGIHVATGLLRLPDPTRHRVSDTELRDYNRVQCSSVVLRRTIFDACGGFDEDPHLRAVEDYHLWLRIAASGGQVLYTPEIVGLYRVANSSTAAREDMDKRRSHLANLGMIDQETQDRLVDRLARRIKGLPRAYATHLIEGPIRSGLGRRPRPY